MAGTAIADGSVAAAKLASSGCTSGQVLQYNGSAWVCAADPGARVGTVGTGQWCVGNASGQVECTAGAPVLAEADPKVGTVGASGMACASTGSQVGCTGSAVTTAQVNYTAPRTGYVALSPSAFTTNTSAISYSSTSLVSNNRYVSSGTSESLYASINLPHGATLTGFACRVTDNSATESVRIGIADTPINTWVCLSPTTSGASPDVATLSVSCNETIDNATSAYQARFLVSNATACGSACLLHSCTATYTYTTEGR